MGLGCGVLSGAAYTWNPFYYLVAVRVSHVSWEKGRQRAVAAERGPGKPIFVGGAIGDTSLPLVSCVFTTEPRSAHQSVNQVSRRQEVDQLRVSWTGQFSWDLSFRVGLPSSSSLPSPPHFWVQPWLLKILRAQLLARHFSWLITSTLLPSYGHPGTSL